MKLNILILLVLASPSIWGHDLCSDLFQLEANKVSVSKQDTEVSFSETSPVELQGEVLQIINNIHQSFGLFKLPASKIDLRYMLDKESMFVSSPQRILFGILQGDGNVRISTPIFVHEYFHLIFFNKFHIRFRGEQIRLSDFYEKSYSETEKLIKELEARPGYLELKTELEKLEKALSKSVSIAEKQENPFWNLPDYKIKALIGQKTGMLKNTYDEDAAHRPRKTANKLSQLLLPYNELFADLGSALYHRSGKIMREALNVSHRDFTHRLNFKNPEKNTTNKGEIDIYNIFDPSRGAIWLMIQKAPSGSEQNILLAFLKAARVHVEERLENGELNLPIDESTILNQKFFRYFVTEGQNLGLW